MALTDNPMSLVINNDVTISVNVSASVPTEETILWRGGIDGKFTLTIPSGVTVLKITTESDYVNNFVSPRLPVYIGVTSNKTYNMDYAFVSEGTIPEPEYFGVFVMRRNSTTDRKVWVSSDAGDASEGEGFTYIDIIMSYSASINTITPTVTDY